MRKNYVIVPWYPGIDQNNNALKITRSQKTMKKILHDLCENILKIYMTIIYLLKNFNRE